MQLSLPRISSISSIKLSIVKEVNGQTMREDVDINDTDEAV